MSAESNKRGHAAALGLGVWLLLSGCASVPRSLNAPLEDKPEAGEILLHAGPLRTGQLVRASIVSRSFPVAQEAAEVRGATQSGLADTVAYDAFAGSGERLLVVTGDFGTGLRTIDRTPLMLTPGQRLAEVWVRVRPDRAVDVSWQMLFVDPSVTVKATEQNDGPPTLEIVNKSGRALTSIRRSALFPQNDNIRACPVALELPSESTAKVGVGFLCGKRDGKATVPLVLSRADGTQLVVFAELSVDNTDRPVLPEVRVGELVTKVGADGALALTAPDGSAACACEGARIGVEHVKLIHAERECVLVEYPDKSQRCLEAQE